MKLVTALTALILMISCSSAPKAKKKGSDYRAPSYFEYLDSPLRDP